MRNEPMARSFAGLLVVSFLALAFAAPTGAQADGRISEFSIPTSSSFPIGIAAGPDGNMWFTENNANKIGKVTTGGSFTEYPIPTSGARPDGIAAGPDGNLWFTEDADNKIGKITTGGSFTEYPIPTGGASPAGIAAGSDGNLWFTELLGNKIGRVNLDLSKLPWEAVACTTSTRAQAVKCKKAVAAKGFKGYVLEREEKKKEGWEVAKSPPTKAAAKKEVARLKAKGFKGAGLENQEP